jgi:uncharacterized protein (TIGR00730 family)
MQYICVYTGSNTGVRPEYQQAAKALGQELVKRGLGLVYGGGRVGLMGIIADTIMAEGGEVVGVMPRVLFPSEVANDRITKLYEVGSMHERKALMADLSDGFIAMPGGFGTLDELFEILTWAQLSIHHKPIGLLNVSNFYNPLLNMVDHLVQEGFVKQTHAGLLLCKESPDELLDTMASYNPEQAEIKWQDLKP